MPCVQVAFFSTLAWVPSDDLGRTNSKLWRTDRIGAYAEDTGLGQGLPAASEENYSE